MTGSHYPHGFKNGVTIKEHPIDIRVNSKSHVYWVDSNNGSNGNVGSQTHPFATIDYAVGKCKAENGDVIYAAAGHVETVTAAAGLDLDVAGITIIFLGEGEQRAYVTFTTAVSADMDVDAADITLINPKFIAGIDALTGPIDVNAAQFTIINGEYHDATDIDTTDCIVADANATHLKISGWRYVPGNEGGTQKQSNIQLNGVDNAMLSDIDIVGDFATGNIENVTDEVLNVRLESIKLKNSNVGPVPGIVLDADATGFAKNMDVRIASGTTYVSNVGKLNWDADCLGYNQDGYGGDHIGTGHAVGLEGKIDAIQADVGDASARTNFQNLEDMIGIPDAANSCLDDMLRTGYDSLAITASENGSIMERLEQIQEAVNVGTGKSMASNKSVADALGSDGNAVTDSAVSVLGAIGANNANNAFDSSTVVANRDGSMLERSEYIINNVLPSVGMTYKGACDVGMAGSTTAIVSDDLAGYGDDYFNNKYYMQVIKNANSVGAAPEIQIRKITDYVSTTGTFTTDAFGANVEESDEILVMHESLVAAGRDDADNVIATTNVVANADGSILERLEYLQSQIVPDLGGLSYEGICDTGMVGSTTTIVSAGMIGYGDDFFNTKYYMQVIKNTNSVGNAPERQVRQITDYVSATGTFTTAAFGANVEEGDSFIIIHELLINIGQDVDGATTDTLHGKIGTDTEMADRSVFDLLGGDGFDTAFPAAAAPAADVSLGEVLHAVYDDTNSISGVALPADPTANSLAAFIASGGTALGTELADSKSIVDALGTDAATVTDSATSVLGAIGADNNNNAFASTSVVGNYDGSVLERLEYLNHNSLNMLYLKGVCDTGMAGSTVTVVCAELAGYGDDFFNYKYYMTVLLNTNSHAAAPELAYAGITDYVSSTGTFTVSGFTANVEEGDTIAVIHEGLTGILSNGDSIIVTKTLTSSDVVQAGVDVTNASSLFGSLMIEDIYMNTDATGLANGTNFVLYTDNANGVSEFAAETVANLGGNKTENIASCSVTSIAGVVLEAGKKIKAKSTVADCTGAGTITLTIKLRRCALGASVTAA